MTLVLIGRFLAPNALKFGQATGEVLMALDRCHHSCMSPHE